LFEKARGVVCMRASASKAPHVMQRPRSWSVFRANSNHFRTPPVEICSMQIMYIDNIRTKISQGGTDLRESNHLFKGRRENAAYCPSSHVRTKVARFPRMLPLIGVIYHPRNSMPF